MLNQTKVHDYVTLITDLGYTCVAGGSSVYLDAGVASDIDIYVDFRGKDIKKFDDDLIDQLTLEGDLVLQEKQQTGNASYASGCSWISKVVDLKDSDGCLINLIAADIAPDPDFAMAVLSTFDYGRIQLGYTKDGLVNTEAYEKDVADGTLTLLHVWSKYHLKMMGKRIEKMQDRFPGHRIVITKDFYHEPEKKSRKVYTNYGSKSGFLAQVMAAQRIADMNRHNVLPVQAFRV